MNQHGGARIREKLEAFCIRHILFKQRVPRKAWRTNLPGVLSIDALLLALWRENSAWALYYLQDQSKRGLRYTHYFYGEVDFYETTVPAEWLSVGKF
jgi:hypothetical protein